MKASLCFSKRKKRRNDANKVISFLPFHDDPLRYLYFTISQPTYMKKGLLDIIFFHHCDRNFFATRSFCDYCQKTCNFCPQINQKNYARLKVRLVEKNLKCLTNIDKGKDERQPFLPAKIIYTNYLPK